MLSNTDTQFWDELTRTHGHTGYADQIIHRYDQPLRLRAMARVLQAVRPKEGVSWTALDIGCGTGDFIQLLLDCGAEHVQGVDISTAVAEKAACRFAGSPARVDITVGSLQDLASSGSTVDIITSVTVLQHIVDDNQAVFALAHLRRRLKDTGRLVVLEIAPEKRVDREIASPVIRERSLNEWQQLFDRAGFALAEPPRVYCPLGFYAVQRLIPAILDSIGGRHWRALGHRGASHVSEVNSTPRSRVATTARRLYGWARQIILTASYPFDYWFGCNLPRRLTYYHLFVLRSETHPVISQQTSTNADKQ